MKKTIISTPIMSIVTHSRDNYNCYSLYLNGKWENDYHSLEELQRAFLEIVTGVYVYAD
ncbi:MAG: hypothetical protein J6S67_17940 [Methanobrevibacter sp.]|nr:hypothetical protein [Methanobrevibacter sp.]